MSYGIPAAEPSAEVPVCPRHPDRPAYVRCQRCGRPACPDCQRAAAVGFQCVDCVNETKRTTPTVRTVYGGAVTTGKPVVTYVIIALCALVYALQWIVPNDGIYQQLAYAPALTGVEPWRMLTSAFLHSQGFLLHIVLNMYTLWIFGQILEPLLGHARFLAIYLLSAVGGSVGFHYGWNLVQWTLLGFPMYGRVGGRWFILQPVGAAWLTGAGYGPENSLLTTVVFALGLGLWLARRT